MTEERIGEWWSEGVIYQVYPRSFADSNGDGAGDLRGVIERIDHLAWLGVDAIWFNPTMPSPNRDWGYDVSDYLGVHPDLGTIADLDELLEAAHARGIRVMLDLVPNHTSDRHPWFLDARSSRDARYRDRYVWADPKPDGSPPNNWRSVFDGGSAWELDPATGQYYLHNFDVGQPDLNWWNEGVRDAFDDILRFWFARGVDGFRVDVAQGIVKDELLRDDPIATEDDIFYYRALGTRKSYSMHRPERHEIFRRWRKICQEQSSPAVLLAEAGALDFEELAGYYGNQDEFQLAFGFEFIHTPFSAGPMRQVVAAIDSAMPSHALPAFSGSNHDACRLATRWCEGDERRVRCALMMLLTLRCAPILYYGDEIGLQDVPIPEDRIVDPIGLAGRPTRDRGRTPMPWSPEPGFGFTRPGVEPWLPFGDHAGQTVREQLERPDSILHLTRDLIRLRRRLSDLRTGAYIELSAPEGSWAWRRGSGVAVALNLSDRDQLIPEVRGRVMISTSRRGQGESAGDPLCLTPFEGVVVQEDAR
jgi:alpha-glucosidase